MKELRNLFSELNLSFRLALRLKLGWLAGTFVAFVSATAVSAAVFSGRQPATLALDAGLSVIRIGLPILAALMLQELVTREFERKLYLISLTYPRARHHFLIGRVAAIGAILLALLVFLAIVLAAITHSIGRDYVQATAPALNLPYIITIGFVALDLIVILAIGTLISVVASTPSFVLIGTIGFALVARSFSTIIALLSRDKTLVGNADTYETSLSFLGYLLPDLATIDVRMIALYDSMEFLPLDWPSRVISVLTYSLGMFSLAVWVLYRKRLP